MNREVPHIFLFFIFTAAYLDLRPELLSGYGEEPGASDNIDTSANLIDGAQIAHTEICSHELGPMERSRDH